MPDRLRYAVIPGGIYVAAVHVALTTTNIFGRIVSGDFATGWKTQGFGAMLRPL